MSMMLKARSYMNDDERESMDWPDNANANLDHKLTMAPQLILLAHIGTLIYPWGHHLYKVNRIGDYNY